MTRPHLQLALVALALGLTCAPAHAQPAPPVPTTFDGCPAPFTQKTTELLTLELHALTPEIEGWAPQTWRLTVRCDPGTARLDLHAAEAPRDGSPLVSRQLDLTALPERDWPRLVALTLTELLAQAHRQPPAPPPTSPEAAPPPPPPAPEPAPTSPSPPRLDLGLGLAVSGFSGADLYYGLEASLDGWPDRASAWTARLGLDLALGRQPLEAGEVRGGWVALAPQWVRRAPLGAGLEMELIGGARLGWARLTGRSEAADVEGRSLQGLWGGPLIGLGLGWGPTRLGAEAGYAPVGVRGVVADGDDVRVDGAWWRLRLGATW